MKAIELESRRQAIIARHCDCELELRLTGMPCKATLPVRRKEADKFSGIDVFEVGRLNAEDIQ